ncbi:hemoglobin-like oxygen-binding protein [Aliidiomarina minuta]|uniref:Hemoglobin-like oxygen-binding protein n=1 Tax=Aliidiomarina minuta TaxID=880057 RepID=A0A432WA96_9GAMM|nr:group II truncated hemoglobin [Aliidiomarina minuta]RUO26955.1 hemoglobin-like oxygen-binding protein [Aliidiomarina minuta]
MLSRFFKKTEPTTATPSQYQQLGGEKAVRAMAERFYDIMQSDPEASDLLAIHPQPMTAIRLKFFEFLSGWLGGPQLFIEKYGDPRLRARHLPFSIDIKMRDQWLHCMYVVLNEQVQDPLLKQQLKAQFTRLAHHMINTAES